MDDSYGMPGMHSGILKVEGGEETSGAWSCVDYHDGSKSPKGVGTWGRYLKSGTARKKRERRALSSRFVATDEYLHAREDEYGKCRAVTALGARRVCDGTEHVGRLVGDRVGAEVDAIWYTGKQTNRGWPGTAEGKINAAQASFGCAVSAILKECKAFAQAVGQQAKDIDGKVCAKKKTGNTDATPATNGLKGKWSCSEGTGQATQPDNTNDLFSKRFTSVQGADNHVKADGATKTDTGWPGTGGGDTTTADGMASDLSTLQRAEKTKVAGLLSKTVSGAEVVEIRAVSTTSVMLNACCPPKPTHVATFTPLPLGRKPCILKLIACKCNTYLDAAKRKSLPYLWLFAM